MRHNNQIGRFLGLFGLCAIALLPMGCNKMLAQYRVRKAQKNVDEAIKDQAPQFNKDNLEATQTKITTAQSQINSGDTAAAAATAKEASTQSSDLLENTKQQFAGDLKDKTNFWIGKAKLNDIDKTDSARFQKVNEDNQSGLDQYGKQKWDAAIATFQKAVNDLQDMLRNLKNDATAGLEDAKALKEDLLKEGAQENAPEFVVKMNSQIEEIQNLITRDNNYQQALLVHNQARQTKSEGITQTKQVKSQKMITEIENLLDQATQLGANLYALQDYSAITKDFENLLTKYYDKNYDTVLAQAPDLKPKVDALILETKRNGAQAKMDGVQTAINNLTDGKARVYLPGSVEQLDALLVDAKALFDKAATPQGSADDYTESKKVSQRALDLEQKILEDYDNLASQQISKAQEEVAKAEAVFSQMTTIFDKPIPGDWTGADKALEDSKQALKQELAASLQNAKLSLGVAQIKRTDDKRFDVAIELSKEIATASENIQSQTYRVVAHNAILEISNELTRYGADGGLQYADAEVKKTQDLLDQSKQLLADSQYRDAVRKAADTKAQLAVVAQELERVGAERIGLAQKALDSAKTHRAQDFQSAEYQQAVVALDRASQAMATGARKDAIESATMAENIATDASTRALKDWTEEYMASSDQYIAKAREAGAERFAPDKLQNAVDLRRNLQQLHDQAAYLEGTDAGKQTLDASRAALYSLIDEGDTAIAAAREYGAWQYEPDRLANAIVSLKYAREALDSGDYRNYELHARNAINLGNKLQLDAKRDSFGASMASLETRLKTAEAKGPGFYQVQDVSKILGEMNQIQNQFDPKDYDDYSKRIEQLEARLAGLVEKTPDTLKELVGKMQERLGELEAKGGTNYAPELCETVSRKIKYAQLDFQNEKYRSSFMNARDAQQTLDQIALQLDEREFDGKLTGYLGDFSDEQRKFSHVLDMGPRTLLQVALGPDGRHRAISVAQLDTPSTLRQNISEIASKVRALEAPPTRRDLKTAALQMFEVAKASATNFEKMLILDQYSMKEARDIIQAAYAQMDEAKKLQASLMTAVKYPQSRFEPKGVERVASTR